MGGSKMLSKVALVALALPCIISAISVGDKIPSIELDHGFAGSTGTKVNIANRAAGKKIILVGLPGAFTPT